MPGKQRDFGGFDSEDDQAALLKPGSKPLTQMVHDDSFREFDFRQYLFACQSRVSVHKSIILIQCFFAFTIVALLVHQLFH